MNKETSHIVQRIKLIRLTKILLLCLLSLSFALEFVVLNLIAVHKEKEVLVVVAGLQVSDELTEVTDTITVVVSQEYKAFLDYVKKKHEEQNKNQTDNYRFTVFNLFCTEKNSFRFLNKIYPEESALNTCYREPFMQEVLSEIFHPPQLKVCFPVA